MLWRCPLDDYQVPVPALSRWVTTGGYPYIRPQAVRTEAAPAVILFLGHGTPCPYIRLTSHILRFTFYLTPQSAFDYRPLSITLIPTEMLYLLTHQITCSIMILI